MLNILMLVMLTIGLTGDKPGVSFQASLGYEPALLVKGSDYSLSGDVGLPDPYGKFYTSHTLVGKFGIKALNGWNLNAVTGLGISTLPNSNSNIEIPSDSNEQPWLSSSMRWTALEYALGTEIGHSFGTSPKKWGLYLGFEFVWGKLTGIDTLYRWNNLTRKNDIRSVSLTSPVKGFEWYAGFGIPLVSFGRFALQLNPQIKGGFLKEQSTNIPPEATWKGPFTLSKWGAALGFTINYQ